MATYVIKSPLVIVNGANITCKTNSMSVTMECEMQEATKFCSSGAKEYLPGLMSYMVEYSGFYSASDNDVDPTTFEAIGSSGDTNFLIAPGNNVTTGDLAYFGTAHTASYNPGGSIGEIMSYDVSLTGDGRPCNGTIIKMGVINVDSSGNGEIYDLGGTDAGCEVQAILQMTNFSGAGYSYTGINISCSSGFGTSKALDFGYNYGEGATIVTGTPDTTGQNFYRFNYMSTGGVTALNAVVAVSKNYGA